MKSTTTQTEGQSTMSTTRSADAWVDEQHHAPRDAGVVLRPHQKEPPGDWRVWALLTGRGWGRSRAAVEWLMARERHGARHMLLLVPEDAAVHAAVLMIQEAHEGVTSWHSARRTLEWASGARCTILAHRNIGRVRGMQLDTIWADNVDLWNDGEEALDQASRALRSGNAPRMIVTGSYENRAGVYGMLAYIDGPHFIRCCS